MVGRRFFSTQGISPKHRLDGWNAFVEGIFPGMVVNGPAAIRAECVSRTVGGINVARIRSQKALIQRWRHNGPACDSAFLHFQISGSVVAFAEHRVQFLRPGDACINRDWGVPYTLDISDDNVALLVDFLPDSIGIDLGGPTNELKRSAAADSFLRYVLALLDEEQVAPGPDMLTSDEAATENFAELFSRFRSGDESKPLSDRDTFHRIAGFVDHRLGDSRLRPSMIADELSLSIRQVQRIFASLGVTPSQYIYKRRINLAAHFLRSGPSRNNVTDLAMELGFSDTAHLCRLFRRQFGTSPMRYAAVATRVSRQVSAN